MVRVSAGPPLTKALGCSQVTPSEMLALNGCKMLTLKSSHSQRPDPLEDPRASVSTRPAGRRPHRALRRSASGLPPRQPQVPGPPGSRKRLPKGSASPCRRWASSTSSAATALPLCIFKKLFKKKLIISVCAGPSLPCLASLVAVSRGYSLVVEHRL